MKEFILIALAYTSIEIVFWYCKWFFYVKKEPLPVAKSLLFAVLYAYTMLLFDVAYFAVFSVNPLADPLIAVPVLLGAVAHLIPVWKQRIGRCATVYAYLIRLSLIEGIIWQLFL